MSNEASVTSGLRIKSGNLSYQPPASTFNADVAGQNGPTPGALTVSTAGTDVNLSQLAGGGGFCELTNYGASVGDADPSHYVEYGIWSTSALIFYPLGKILPGETYVIRLSDNILMQEPGTGTGPASGTTTFRLKAHNSPCTARINAFDK